MNQIIKKTLFVLTVHSEKYRNNLFYDEVRRGINIQANLEWVNVEFLFGFDHKIETFAEAIGVIFAPDGTLKCKELLEEIKKTYQIPIIQVDNQISDEQLAPRVDGFVGTDNFFGGKLTAAYLKTYLKKGDKILVIAGSQSLPFLSYNQRLDGFKAEMENYAEIEEVLYGDFDHQKIYTQVHEYLEKKTLLPAAVFAFNDDSAIIARKVINEKGLTAKIIIAGFDGSAAGRVALSKKQIICSYDQNPEDLGRKALRLYLESLKKNATPAETLIKGTLLTIQNIGITYHAGVENFLDRTLTPFIFRKRKYELFFDKLAKPLADCKNELICPIILGDKCELGRAVKEIEADRFIIVSDDSVYLKKESLEVRQMLEEAGNICEQVSFAQGEKNKNPQELICLIEKILAKGITKKSCLLLLGGGVTGNIGGLAASLLYRGIKFVHIPTTLMHMVDSSTGGKQAVDSESGKNTIGNFYEPEFIFIDVNYLQALPEIELVNGLAESIKHALCQDKDFYDFILRENEKILKRDEKSLQEIVERTIRLKLKILENDSYELSEGMVLVYGHTIGNAIESASKFKLSHGQAISMGMVAAAKIALMLGITNEELVVQHVNIFRKYDLPVVIPAFIELTEIMDFLKFDKKHVDNPMSFVLLEGIGKVYMQNGVIAKQVDAEIISKVLREMY
ncbi:MAG: substrate-binding domain-containing protein [Candidatus Moraniibacteriota bacterium]